MANIRRFGPADLLLLVLVLAVAGGLRAGYLMQCADSARSDGPLRVQDKRPPLVDFKAPEDMRGAPRPTEMDALIYNIKEYLWFGVQAPFAPGEEQTAHVSPGYPWLVGLLARYIPGDQLDNTVRWAQLGLGTLTAGFYFLFARRAFRSLLVGLLAGLFAAINPFSIVDTATIDDGVLASFALAGCLLLGGRSGEKGGPLGSLLFGLALAGLALVRAALLPFSFVALVWFLLRSRSLAGGWLAALLAFFGFLIGLAPWTVRNYQVFQEPVPLVSSAYLHLWAGNNPLATGGPLDPKMLDRVAGAELRGIANQPARYGRLGPIVVEEVRDHPVKTLQRRERALLGFFLGDRGLANYTLAERTGAGQMPEWLDHYYPGAFQAALLAMLVFGFLGWRWSYGWRWESAPAAVAMIWVPLPYILSHSEGLSGLRLPLDGVLLMFAAFAVVALVPGLNGNLLNPTDAGPTPPQPAPAQS
jgi:hypothetical protein